MTARKRRKKPATDRPRIALFGGSFDPPHVAHQMVCLYTLSAAAVSEVWVVPCLQHPLDKTLTEFKHRYRMCRLAVRDLKRVKVTDVESKIGPPSRTLKTLSHLTRQHPDHTFVLTVGADILHERHRWYGWDKIVALSELFIVGRSGFRDDAPVKLPRLSSSKIRRSLARGEPVKGLVPEPVLDYIEKHGLYGRRG